MIKQSHLSVSSHLEDLSAVQQWFQTRIALLAEGSPWIDEQFDQLNLALAEGFTNAVRHAHSDLPSSTPIEIELIVQPEQVEIRIFDQGEPFDPSSLREPKPGSLCEGGYGWFLLRRLADQVTYECVVIDRSRFGRSDRAPENTVPVETKIQRNCLKIVKTSKIV